MKGLIDQILNYTADKLPVIGKLYQWSWTASSAAGTGTALTGAGTLPAGTYIIIVQAPVISGNTTMRISGVSDKYISATHNHETGVLVAQFDADTSVQLQLAQSGSVTFTYRERGGMKAIRVA